MYLVYILFHLKRILDLLRIVVPGQQLEKTLLSFGIKDMFRSGLKKVSSIIDRGRMRWKKEKLMNEKNNYLGN